MSDDGFECDAWDLDWQKPEDQAVLFPIFEINIQARLTQAPNEEDEDEESSFIVPDSLVIQKTEQVRVHQLLDDNNNNNVVRDMLVSMGVPIQDFMVDRILACVQGMTTSKRYMNRKVLRMQVEIEAIVAELPDEDDDHDEGFSSLEKAAMVENLMKKVVVERPNTCCPICIEDFPIGFEAIIMPNCSHLFHHACIVPWLSKKQQCPLCRSELSSDAVTEAKKKIEGGG